jgi:nucleotide-binding universal stress UspA family protein
VPLVDQFESVFKAAAKPVYHYRRCECAKALVVTDLETQEAHELTGRIRRFLQVLEGRTDWITVTAHECRTVAQLLGLVGEHQPDLVVTYRNLHSDAWHWPHSLGRHLDVLTQATEPPVLVIPHPNAGRELDHALQNTDVVMALTDLLAGDQRLVNCAVQFTAPQGTLFLTHVEDAAVFERYMSTIAKLPAIDTDTAREAIRSQLLKDAQDYIRICKQVLESEGVPIRVEQIVAMGDPLNEYRRMIQEHEVDLLVLNTKDQNQLAMHGRAYSLAVELRQIPLLML